MNEVFDKESWANRKQQKGCLWGGIAGYSSLRGALFWDDLLFQY